jgi:hypothetical protein
MKWSQKLLYIHFKKMAKPLGQNLYMLAIESPLSTQCLFLGKIAPLRLGSPAIAGSICKVPEAPTEALPPPRAAIVGIEV